MTLDAKRACAGLVLAITLSAPSAWAGAQPIAPTPPPAADDKQVKPPIDRGPVKPAKLCIDSSGETDCKPCWIEPWLCHPPIAPPPCVKKPDYPCVVPDRAPLSMATSGRPG
jgi:hypothetical protein